MIGQMIVGRIYAQLGALMRHSLNGDQFAVGLNN